MMPFLLSSCLFHVSSTSDFSPCKFRYYQRIYSTSRLYNQIFILICYLPTIQTYIVLQHVLRYLQYMSETMILMPDKQACFKKNCRMYYELWWRDFCTTDTSVTNISAAILLCPRKLY